MDDELKIRFDKRKAALKVSLGSKGAEKMSIEEIKAELEANADSALDEYISQSQQMARLHQTSNQYRKSQ